MSQIFHTEPYFTIPYKPKISDEMLFTIHHTPNISDKALFYYKSLALYFKLRKIMLDDNNKSLNEATICNLSFNGMIWVTLNEDFCRSFQ